MKKQDTFTVSEEALRKMLREAMLDSNGHLGDLTVHDEQEEEAPVNVSGVVDPSAAVTDPMDPCYVPQSRQELEVTLNSIISDVPIDKIPLVFRAVKDALAQSEEEDDMNKEMKKAEQNGVNVEGAVRKLVRQALQEISPRFDMSYSGTEYGDSDDDEDDLEDVKPKRAYKSTAIGNMADVGGASFEEIAKELNFSVAGAKQAVDKSLLKAQYLARDIDPDDLEIMILTAMNDYIKMLQKTGELTSADVELMKAHPDIVRELDGFREFLGNVIRRARKKGQKVEDPLGEED